MYFYELFKKCDKNVVYNEFLKLMKPLPRKKRSKKNIKRHIKSAINEILAINQENIELDDNFIIFIEDYYDEINGENYQDVHVLDKRDDTKYGLMINPWNDTCGYQVDADSVKKYGKEKFVVCVLWEMTWLGFSNEKVQKKVKSWDNR